MPRMNSSGSIFAVRVEIELPLAASLSTEAPYGLRPAVALSFSASGGYDLKIVEPEKAVSVGVHHSEEGASSSASGPRLAQRQARGGPPAMRRPLESSCVGGGGCLASQLAPHVEVGFCLPESRHNRLLVDARQRSERGSRVAPTLVARATRCTWTFVHGT